MSTYYLEPRNGRKSFYRKAKVEVLKNGITRLYSYDTLVCSIDSNKGEVRLKDDWCYSNTTISHVRSFLEENGYKAGSKAEIAKRYER